MNLQVVYNRLNKKNIMETENLAKSKKSRFSKVFIIVLAFIMVLLLTACGYFYYQYKLATVDPQKEQQKKASSIVKEVGQYMQLPQDDQVNIIEVNDKNQYSGQPLFMKAQNGDKMLFFTKANLAVLYRPSSKKIITVSQAY